jgi:UDP-N-acetylmuramate dehydrogenase
MLDNNALIKLRQAFGVRLQENVRLANYATMNVGGPADALLIANSSEELAGTMAKLWEMDLQVKIIGSGSNILISDKGIRSVVVINHAHNIRVNQKSDPITVHAESGALMVNVSKKLALWGLAGLEWAAAIPGTVGGAVYGNAGAFGGEICRNLVSADILNKSKGRTELPCDQLGFGYRSSCLKCGNTDSVILAALFQVVRGNLNQIANKIETNRQTRLKNQPPGASIGSVFRNPPDEKAGRLIEAAGLKGQHQGAAIISPKHANFIINEGGATAQDVLDLLIEARSAVKSKFNVELIPEIEVLGEWDNLPDFLKSNHTAEIVNQ